VHVGTGSTSKMSSANLELLQMIPLLVFDDQNYQSLKHQLHMFPQNNEIFLP
jgi:hypothetical protein